MNPTLKPMQLAVEITEVLQALLGSVSLFFELVQK